MILRSLLIFIGVFSQFDLGAQSEEDFEKFSRDFFILLSDSTQMPPLEYIRIKTWRQLVQEQDLDQISKDEWLIQKNESYPLEYQEFTKKLGGLVEAYQKALANGAQFEFLSHSYSAHEKWKNWYQAQFRFIFSEDELQSVVQINYELYYNGRGLVFLGTQLEEDF